MSRSLFVLTAQLSAGGAGPETGFAHGALAAALHGGSIPLPNRCMRVKKRERINIDDDDS